MQASRVRSQGVRLTCWLRPRTVSIRIEFSLLPSQIFWNFPDQLNSQLTILVHCKSHASTALV